MRCVWGKTDWIEAICTAFGAKLKNATLMFLSAKTIDGYRNSLFDKFGVRSRTGLALFAVRNGLVPL
jgi:two-component system, NarL family, invasion response regulator UvrY